ncbi:site-2 protease family protein [Desulfofundulus thermocisternus]|uniref:site-2 protease family protein n=1 Tax=Desulfofundulus thermocisternus TaxID=42471 RepID=UPI0035C7505F
MAYLCVFVLLVTHETGHYIAGIFLGYKAKRVIIGGCKPSFAIVLNNTVFEISPLIRRGECGNAGHEMPDFNSAFKAFVFYIAGTLATISLSTLAFIFLRFFRYPWAVPIYIFLMILSIDGIVPKADYCDGKAVLCIAKGCLFKQRGFHYIKNCYNTALSRGTVITFKMIHILYLIISFSFFIYSFINIFIKQQNLAY